MLDGSGLFNVPEYAADRVRLVNELCGTPLVVDIVKRRKPLAPTLAAAEIQHVAITESVKRRAAARGDGEKKAAASPPETPPKSSEAGGASAAGSSSAAATPSKRQRLPVQQQPAGEDVSDEALLAKCTVKWTQRKDKKQWDATTITPDGIAWRSKVTALAHMRSLQ